MGNYFSNVYVRRSDQATNEALTTALTECFVERGMVPCAAEEADFSVLLQYAQDRPWIAVYCDGWGYEEILETAPLLSGRYHTDVLSCACFDSDYMFLHLLNESEGVDAFVNIGKSDEIKPPRRTTLAAWKTRVKDFDAFKNAVKQSYVCAEDFLLCVQEQLALPEMPSSLEGCSAQLYFRAPQEKKPTPPRLRMFTSSLLPCKPGKPEYWSVINEGGASLGVRIVFFGFHPEIDGITLENVTLRYENERGQRIDKLLELKEIVLAGGDPALCASIPDFKIQSPPSPDLPPMAQQKKMFARSFGVRFTPRGNERKFLDITVAFIPLANPVQGQCSWRVWGEYPTKKSYIEAHNHASEQDHKLYGVPADLIDPAVYDLD